jgi:hypothetical protein
MQVCESVPKEDFAGARVAFLRQRRVAHAGVTRAVLLFKLAARGVEMPVAVRVVDHVVEIFGRPCSFTKSRRMSTLRLDIESAVKM